MCSAVSQTIGNIQEKYIDKIYIYIYIYRNTSSTQAKKKGYTSDNILISFPGHDSRAIQDHIPDGTVVAEDGSPPVNLDSSDGLTSRVNAAESQADGLN